MLGNGEKSCCFRVCGGREKLMQRPLLMSVAGGETIGSGRCAPSIFDCNCTMASLSQWIKFRDSGYKDTHFPPQFGRNKCIFCYNTIGQNVSHLITIEKFTSRELLVSDLQTCLTDYQHFTKAPEKAKQIVNYLYKTEGRNFFVRKTYNFKTFLYLCPDIPIYNSQTNIQNIINA